MSRPIVITIRMPVIITRAGDCVLVKCQFSGVSGAGASTDEALGELSRMLTDYFGSSFDLGDFNQLFLGNGYSALGKHTEPSEGHFLDIELKLGTPHLALATQEGPPPVAWSLPSISPR